MTSHPFLVIYDPDAVLELEELSSRQERKARSRSSTSSVGSGSGSRRRI